MPLVLLGCLGLVAAIAASNLIPTDTTGRIIGGVMVVLFGFLFVTVSSRITGVIGSSSNPISGMTIATLLLTCLIFVLLGWVGPQYRLAALSIAGVVCIASSNGGTTSQDLKTGYLVGATPWKQQVSILVGALVSATGHGGDPALAQRRLLDGLRPARGSAQRQGPRVQVTHPRWQGRQYLQGLVGREPGARRLARKIPGRRDGSGRLDRPGHRRPAQLLDLRAPLKKFNPPQPRLFATIIDGIMKGDLPWGLVILGAVLAVVMQLAGVSALAFAVGVYLPLSTTLPIFVGGLIRAVVDRLRKFSAEESDMSPGTMMSTGLIAGGSLAGIIIALLVVFEKLGQASISRPSPPAATRYLLPALGAFTVIAVALLAVALVGKRPVAEETKDETIGEI